MRILCCFLLLLSACASQSVHCNGHLRPINVATGQVSSVAGGAIAVPSSSVP